MRRFGLQYQIMGWLFLIGVLPAAAVSAYAYWFAHAGLLREAAASMRADGDAAVDLLDESFALARAQVTLVARQVAQRVQEAKEKAPPKPRVKALPGSPVVEDFEPARRMLTSWGATGLVPFQSWVVVDTAVEPRLALVDGKPGSMTLSDGEREQAALAQAAPAGETLFGGVVTSTRKPGRVLAFATPIAGRDGAVWGSLHAEVPVEWLSRTLHLRATRGGSLWTFDHSGQLILATDSGPDAETMAAALWAKGRSAGERAGQIPVGAEALWAVFLPVSVAGASAPWSVAVSVPEQMIVAQAEPWRYVTMVGIPAVAVLLVALLVGAAMTRPIKTLEEGTRRIAQGDLDFDLQVGGRNELERLAGSFREMAYALKRARERLTKAERMAAIGEESLAIEHDVHQSLKTVMGAAERVLASPELPEAVRAQVAPIHEAAARMRDLLKKLEHVHEEHEVGGAV